MSPWSIIKLPQVKKSIFCCPHVKILTYSICLGLFWLVNSAWSVHIYFLIQTRWSFHWRKQYDGLQTCVLAEIDLILTNMQLFTSQDVNLWTGVVWIVCGLLWCFYQLFGFSFWRHPFTAEHPLVSKWCNAKYLQICSSEETHFFP